MSTLLSASSSTGGPRVMDDAKPPMCLSPQDKLKGSSAMASLAAAAQRKKAAAAGSASSSVAPTAALSVAVAVSALAMDFDMADTTAMDLDGDLDLDLVDDSGSDHGMDDAGWVSDDNLRALEFDDRLNQDIDWVTHDDVEASLKLEFIPSGDDVQDFAFDPSSFLSPLRGGLSFDDSDMSSSFAASLSVDTPPPSFGTTSHDAEKLLMSFDTMNFTIPSPTSSSTKKRAGLFGKKDADAPSADKTSTSTVDASARQGLAAKRSMSPLLKLKTGVTADDLRKDDACASLAKLAIPTPEPFLGALSISTPTKPSQSADSLKKIGSYSPEARRLRIQKFHEKRKNRTWKKSIKYDCRKKLADDRPRIKGRFVRVHDNTPEIKEEDSCSSAASSSGGSPAPSSTGSPCAGSPVKAEPVAMPAVAAPAVAPVVVPPVAAATLIAAQLQPVPAIAAVALPAPVAAPVSAPVSACPVTPAPVAPVPAAPLATAAVVTAVTTAPVALCGPAIAFTAPTGASTS